MKDKIFNKVYFLLTLRERRHKDIFLSGDPFFRGSRFQFLRIKFIYPPSICFKYFTNEKKIENISAFAKSLR